MDQSIEITNEFIQKKIATGKRYSVLLYKAGSRYDLPPGEAERVQAEHIKYIFKLRAEGILLINGPVLDETELKAIGICSDADLGELRKIFENDPGVISGKFIFEIHPMFGIPGDRLP